MRPEGINVFLGDTKKDGCPHHRVPDRDQLVEGGEMPISMI